MKPILNLKAYTITRTTAADAVIGRRVAGIVTSVPITANVQPANTKQLMALPEVRRGERLKRFFTSTEIYIVGQVVGGITYDADRITIKGEEWEIYQVDDWADDHFECYCSRVQSP